MTKSFTGIRWAIYNKRFKKYADSDKVWDLVSLEHAHLFDRRREALVRCGDYEIPVKYKIRLEFAQP